MPWRESQDFYPVWLSEIMLQQTRVEAVIPYYARFLERFPTLDALAAAGESEVLAVWSGLGYYSRGRNLLRAAKLIADSGAPRSYEDVLRLPGVGGYTAAAIASIALGLPHAAVDGNVMRVISRLTNDASEIGSSAARKRFSSVAAALLAPRRPGDFNQAMMELGATLCVPRAPACGVCPVARYCSARAHGTAPELPVKLGKKVTRDITLNLVLIRRADHVFLVQRDHNERRMAGFWELPAASMFPRPFVKELYRFFHPIVNDRYDVSVRSGRPGKLPPGKWFSEEEVGLIPLTTITRKALLAARSG